MTYEYDVEDSWEHMVHFLGHADQNLGASMCMPSDQTVFYIGGEGHPCCEDCGSDPGWETLKVSSIPRVLCRRGFDANCGE